MFCATTAKRTKSDRGQRAKHVLGVLTFKTELQPSRSNEYRASMHWGVACIAARADVFAMMMGSLTDDR